jgi:hypothetical protein
MQTPGDIPYWMRNIGRDLRAHCEAGTQLPFIVKLSLLRLLQVERALGLRQTHPGPF